MSESEVLAVESLKTEVATTDGRCPAYLYKPQGGGSWPAVIFYMDGFGIRPVLFQMAERLASGGYVVLLPDLYYRAGPYEAVIPKEVFARGNIQNEIGRLLTSTDNGKATADTRAFLDHLHARADVADGKIAVVGYCRTGAVALTVAATYPDEIAAAASFHGGNLATDADDSPHRLAATITAPVYVAGADQDNSYPVAMAARLEQALTDAGVAHRCEIYAGAKHGWTMADFPVYDEAAAERHWRELSALLERTLKGGADR